MIRQLKTAVSRQQTGEAGERVYGQGARRACEAASHSCEAEMTPASLLRWHGTHAMHGCSQEEGSRTAFDGHKPLISHQG